MTQPKPELPEPVAYRWEAAPMPGCKGWDFASHWSTPPQNVEVTSLYTAEQMHAYRAAAPQPEARDGEAVLRGRYFCDGPDGHFYMHDLEAARRVVNIIDPVGDDWTITDLDNPFGIPTPKAAP